MNRRTLGWLMAGLCVTADAAASQQSPTLDPTLSRELRHAAKDEFVRVLVTFRAQADLPVILEEVRRTRGNLAERHYRVITAAQDVSATTQGPVLALLEQAHRAGQVRGVRSFWIQNAIALEAQPAVVSTLLRRSELKTLYWDPPIELIAPVSVLERSDAADVGVEINVELTGAPELWALGIDGTGTLACHQDTGVDGKHPALAGRWRGLEPGVQPEHAWFDPVYHSTFPTDSDIHGTHTMGTIVGDDGGSNQIGVAPGAQWIAAKTIDISGGNIYSDALAAFQWAADPDGDPTTLYDVPDVVSNSWGLSASYYGACLDDFNTGIDVVEAAGVPTVWAAGNEGSGGLRSPGSRIASAYNTFAIGALNPDAASVASFSSRGPSQCDGKTLKPEVSAVGVDVRSSIPNNGYGYLDGTSMSTPAVAGAILLLRQAYPQATPEELKSALYLTAIDVGTSGEDNAVGMGSIDVMAAYDYLKRALIGSAGQVRFSRSLYACSETLQVEVADVDLLDAELEIWVSSPSEPNGERVTLGASETPGLYRGNVPVALSSSAYDGILSVADGASVEAHYLDEDDGDGGVNLSRVGSTRMDCLAPAFAGLKEAIPGDYRVSLLWEAASDASAVRYEIYRSSSATAPGDLLLTVPELSYVDLQVQNGETYYYQVVARDEVGNRDGNGVVLAVSPVGPVRLLKTTFEEGTGLAGWTVNNTGRCKASWHLDTCSGTWCSGSVALIDHWDCLPTKGMDASLVSPPIDFSGVSSPELRFSHYFDQGGSEIGDVDYSTDGRQWTNLTRYRRQSVGGPVVIDLSMLEGRSAVSLRFHYHEAGMSADDWGLDNIEVVGWLLD